MPTQKIRFAVCGAEYVITTNDKESYVLELAEKLDRDMNEMLGSSPTASVTASAIVTALSYLDESKKAVQSADHMRAQIKDYLEDAAKAKFAVETSRREVAQLKKEIAALKAGTATTEKDATNAK